VPFDPEHIRDLFAGFGPVQVRRMFGGAGVYAEGLMFALVSDGVIYLKAGAPTALRFEAEACGPFEYATMAGRRAIRSYWRMPDWLYDDPDALVDWAREALGAARQAGAKKGRATSARRKAQPKR
jgi:DNA transformation protein